MSGSSIQKSILSGLALLGLIVIPVALAAQPVASHKKIAKPASKAQTAEKPDKSPANQTPFVIRETYREAQPDEGEKGVVGFEMLIEPGHYPVVQRVFQGTPAASQGIRIGDTILTVNGVRVNDKSAWQVDRMISDVPGDVVNLTILRSGRLRKFELTVMPLSEAAGSVRSSFAGGLISRP